MNDQALVDFLVDHPCLDIDEGTFKEIEIGTIGIKPYKFWFNSFKIKHRARADVVLVSPHRPKVFLAFLLNF